jgi:hypothetical protein
MVALLFFLLRLVVSPFRSISRLEAENAALRRQLIVLQRLLGKLTEPSRLNTEPSRFKTPFSRIR